MKKSAVTLILNKILSNKTFWSLWGFSILISLVGFYITRNYLMDDALITLRYSFNFAKFGIPFWNQADLENPSMGYTSILWMAINAIPAFFTSNKDTLVLLAKTFSLASLFIIAALISREIASLAVSTPMKFLAVFVIFSNFGYGLHVNSAMETMLFSCIVLLTVQAYAKNQYRNAYLFGALSFLVRPEGAILFGLLCLWDLFNRNYRRAVISGIIFSLLVAAALSIIFFWYGELLPNTFYAKQEVLNRTALLRTTFFIITLAFPFLLMSIFAAFPVKNKMSMYMVFAAIAYIIYYISVDPLMNVMSRYQWPSLVLLTYASIPAFGFLINNFRKYKIPAIVLLMMFIVLNFGNGLGASYFESATGHAESNIILIGKRMAKFRDTDKWLVYHDAGAICYFSDWNTHETIGLTNKQIAKKQIQLTDIYENPNSQIVMRNFDLGAGQQTDELEYSNMLSLYGFQHVQDIPILYVEGQRNFVIAVYARDRGFADTIFSDFELAEPLKPNFSFKLYQFAKDIFGR
jgi:hypothetical protein